MNAIQIILAVFIMIFVAVVGGFFTKLTIYWFREEEPFYGVLCSILSLTCVLGEVVMVLSALGMNPLA